LLPTVLAGILVPIKYLESAQFFLMARTLYHVSEPDYGRYLKYVINRVKFASAILHHFSFAMED